MDLTEAEDIKKSGKNTQKNYTRKIFMTQITTMGMITHLESDILESKAKWALGSITTNKASRGDRIPAELFHILKDDAVKYASKFGKLSSGHRTGKGQFSFQSLRKVMPKNVQTTSQPLILHTSKVILKILQASFQRYVNQELPDVQAGFRKGRGTRYQIANICWIIEKANEFQKNIYFCFIEYTKALTVWITINCGKFLKV